MASNDDLWLALGALSRVIDKIDYTTPAIIFKPEATDDQKAAAQTLTDAHFAELEP